MNANVIVVYQNFIHCNKKTKKQTLTKFSTINNTRDFFYSDLHNKLFVYIGQSLVSKPKNEMATRTTDEREIEHGR